MLRRSNQVEEEGRKVFASYHFTSMDGKYNGFGNYIGRFNAELYAGDIEKFVLHLEKSIMIELEHKLNIKVAVKVLFFR